ncbi:HNH endonuclease [Gordonia phage Gmala1]|uniref:Uncharacterized protein n=2 Tax=Gordtnkvirus gordtnk2 TaxID=1982219 RepID=A0A0E3T618_9CAUD|nr:HNH endonuclease [Gordonia phage Gmala1]YP_009222491.1 HNH endonuclease [Gordonia phage GordDuk1]AKC02876.1 hypothetical protein Gmala1_38 [Gordonia phage Gmala1]AKC02966.1 hypothetical protein GordDuk1_38 [Gordonia phage GordDuk1]
MCSKHYQRFKRLGFTELVERPKECTKKGCNKPIKAKGLCHNHYNYSLIGPRPNRSESAKLREKRKQEERENSKCRLGCGRYYHELPAAPERIFNWGECPGTPRKKKYK